MFTSYLRNIIANFTWCTLVYKSWSSNMLRRYVAPKRRSPWVAELNQYFNQRCRPLLSNIWEHKHRLFIAASVPLKEITCVDFESGWNGMRATKGIYIAASNVGIKSHTKFGRSANFNGFSATLKIPRFTWSYR